MAVCIFFCQPRGLQAVTIITPSVNAQITYDDNILFSYYKPVDDWIYEIFPALDIAHQDERNEIHLTTAGHGQHYDTETQLDTFDFNVNLRAKRQQTERLSLSFNGRYTQDTTLDQELLETGQLLRREDRQYYSLAPEIEWIATERSAVSISLPYVNADYKGRGSVDYQTLYLYLTYSYLLSDEKTRLFIRPDIGRMKFDTGKYRTADLMCGIESDITERLYTRILAGFNYTSSTSDIIRLVPMDEWPFYYLKKEKQSDDYWGWVAEGEIRWQWDRGNLDALFTRRVTASGYGEPVMSTYFTPRASWRITDRLTGRLGAGISRIESDTLTYTQDYYTYSVRPSLSYRVARSVFLGIHYTYEYIDDKKRPTNRDRNRVFLSLEIRDFNLNLRF